MPALLSVKDVVKKYSSHLALDHVSIDVPEDCIFGLLGPNGAGKTSLIRIINQITGPDEGEVFFNGQPLQDMHVQEIGYLPEERGLYRKMKVGEQCIYLARLKGLKKKEAEQKIKYWFEKFEITAWWNKKVEELSKGMQQKVQFIVTILHEPRLLILDEPFSGFDPINANLLKNEILELRKKGATIIFSTHNMGSVEELCDQIALLNKSKKILDGSVSEIRKQFKNNLFEIGFKGEMLSFANSLWTGAEIIKEEKSNDHIKVQVKILGDNKPNDLLSAVLPVVDILSFNEVVPSMNEIFIKAIGKENLQSMNTSNLTE